MNLERKTETKGIEKEINIFSNYLIGLKILHHNFDVRHIETKM